MAKRNGQGKSTASEPSLEARLWQAADALRNNMDAAERWPK